MNGFYVFAFGIGAIVIMMLVEGFVAARQRRRPEARAVIIAGVIGMAYFVGMLYATGAL